MKSLLAFTLLVLSLGVFAKEKTYVRPQVTVFPNQVQLRVWNTTNTDIRCSGTISVFTRMGRYRTFYYNSVIYRGMTDYRYFQNYIYNDPFVNAHHSIFCNRY